MRGKRLKFAGLVAVVLVAALISAALLPVQVSITGEGVLSVEPREVGAQTSISDIPAYGAVEPSGCGEFKGRVKVRIDMFMTSDAPYYDRHHVYIVDETSEEYQGGYPGKIDPETGEPLDWEDYQNWWDSLPHVWQNNPFHSHMVYFDTKVTDESIKAKVVEVTEYFYAFHLYCWNEEKDFIEDWKRVPVEAGTVRESIIASVEGKNECEVKVAEILLKVDDYDTRNLEPEEKSPPDLNIGEKGTVDVGSPAITRGAILSIWNTVYYTVVEGANSANADGEIDTVEAYFFDAAAGNSIKYGTFENLGSNLLKCHDAEVYGAVSAGSKQTCTGLTIAISTGEFIGADARAAKMLRIYRDYSGGTNCWEEAGQYCDPNDQATFGYDSGDILSLYATGTETPTCDPSIEASESTWDVNGGTAVVEDTIYSTGLTWCTITNNSGGDVSITIGGTDMTGGAAWDLSDDGSNGDMICGMYAGLEGASYNVIVKESGPYNTLVSGLADSGTQKFGLQLETPTVFDDGVEKSGTVTLTATCD